MRWAHTPQLTCKLDLTFNAQSSASALTPHPSPLIPHLLPLTSYLLPLTGMAFLKDTKEASNRASLAAAEETPFDGGWDPHESGVYEMRYV